MQPVLKFAGESFEKDGVRLVILSNETKDRDGDVVRASGWDLANFSKAPRLMSCHNYGSLTSQIGEWRNVHVDASLKALVGEPVYYVNQGNAEADWGAYLASIGQATYSVGFAPETSTPMKGGGFEFTSQELLECSHVPIPSNPDALQLMAKAFASRSKEVTAADETADAATAQQAIDIVNRLIAQESAELASDPDDADDVYALLSIRSMLVAFAQGEQQEALMLMGLVAQPRLKAGRVLSASNLDKFHSALTALKSVHDGACDTADCPMQGESEPPAERDKAVKAGAESDGRIQGTFDPNYHVRADSGVSGPQRVLTVRAASEGSASEGGATVGETHGAFDGTHSHPHAANGSQGDDATHDHAHTHDGSGSHGHEHKSAEPAETKQPDATTVIKSYDLEAALDEVLAGVEL